jgi:ribosomal protein S27AE
MVAKRLEITLDEAAWDRLNAVRGHEPRASFVKRALRDALFSRAEIVAADREEMAERINRALAPDVERSSPGCPECGSDMSSIEGRWVCGDCGFAR